MRSGQNHTGLDAQRSKPPKDRRLPPDRSTAAPLRWLRALMSRPFRLGWRSGGLRLLWVERRRGPAPDAELLRLRLDLQAELLAHDNAALLLRELMLVNDALTRAGWAGLAALPARVISRARVQADRLAESTRSAPLAGLAARLRALQASTESGQAAAAASPPTPQPQRPALAGESVEVSELGEDAYAQAEQAWVSSQIAELVEQPPKDDELKA